VIAVTAGTSVLMIDESGLRLAERDGVWALTGLAASRSG
jgi:hypothetical protein